MTFYEVNLKLQDIIDEQARMAKELSEIRGLLEKPKKNSGPKGPKKEFDRESDEYNLTNYFVDNLCVSNDVFNKKYSKMSYTQQVNHIQRWAQDIDKLIRIDGQSPEDIKKVIEWVFNDPFWSTVVLSTANLRKNFPKLYPKVFRNHVSSNKGSSKELI